MKKFIFATVALLAVSSVFAYDIAEKMELKVTPKSLTRTDYTIVSKFGEYFRTPSTKFVYKYNSAGKISESEERNPRDVLVNKIVNTYDAQGLITAETCFDSQNAQIWNTEIKYTDGKKSESSGYSKTGVLKGKTIYTYTNNNLTDESFYDGEGAIVWKIVTTYDARNKVETRTEYNSDGILSTAEHYAYNPSGILESISYKNDKDELTSKDVFRYDDAGSLSEITRYNAENKIIKRTLVKHDTQGNITKITAYNVARKFGSTVNEMAGMTEFAYEY